MNPQNQTQPQKTTARDFFINLGVIVALYTVVGNLIDLLFTVIDKAYPQITAGAQYYQSTYSISFPVAAIIIFFPIFILLSWLMTRDYATQPEKKNIGIHKWLTYITLFFAGLTFAGDLVTVLYYFLDGQELTTGFLLKVLVVLVVAGLVFFYYLSDVRRMLSRREKMIWRIVAGVLVVGSIVWGFAVLGSPWTQELVKYDEQKVSDLQNINSRVQSYYEENMDAAGKSMVPMTLADLSAGDTYNVLPLDPQTHQSYEYVKTNDTSYQLCATFNKASMAQNYPYPNYAIDGGTISWNHPAGHYCYSETISAQAKNTNIAYPPTSNVPVTGI